MKSEASKDKIFPLPNLIFLTSYGNIGLYIILFIAYTFKLHFR